MNRTLEPTGPGLTGVHPGAPGVLTTDDRRQLTRFLSRHSTAVALLDACVGGHGPLPGLMDRFVCRVVDMHRRLSGGTFVDAGESLDIHPQSLRVLARKVQERGAVNASDVFLMGDVPGGPSLWWVVTSALLLGQSAVEVDELVDALAPWEGPLSREAVLLAVSRWEREGLLARLPEGTLVPTAKTAAAAGDAHARSRLLADVSVDMAAAYLSMPLEKQGKPLPVRFVLTRAVFERASFDATAQDMLRHLEECVAKAWQRYGGTGGGDRVCISLVAGPSGDNLREAGQAEREIWINAMARHLARHGGLREAMPILYQEVARELRRRSVKRAYDPELLEAVGRARQNVHEWEAGRGFHFRGPAPLTAVEDNADAANEGLLRQYGRLFLQERSHRPCTVREFSGWLQKEVGLKVDDAILVRILDDEVAMGSARAVREGQEHAFQAVKTFRRAWAQNIAQRRANLEIGLRALSGLIVGRALGRPHVHETMRMVTIPSESLPFFVQEVTQTAADYHAQFIRRFEDLEPDEGEGLDVEAVLIVTPSPLAIGKGPD